MDFLDTAIKLHQHGWVEEAEQAYREILAAEPNHAGAMHLLGVIRQQQGEARRGIGADRPSDLHQSQEGRLPQQLRRGPALARALCRGGSESSPVLAIRANYADAWANLGMVETALGKEEAALESFQKALHFDPRHRDGQSGWQGFSEALLAMRKQSNYSVQLAQECAGG